MPEPPDLLSFLLTVSAVTLTWAFSSSGVFQLAIQHQIELYRIVPNATHLMQPLDKGVFGPLKKMWNAVTRAHYRENPGVKINRTNFAQKLKEAYMQFYKPLTVVNSFKASGIYPVDSTMIADGDLKPGLTYEHEEDNVEIPETASEQPEHLETIEKVGEEAAKARGALEVLESILSTPVKERYQARLMENFDVVGLSPTFDTYKALATKARITRNAEGDAASLYAESGLDVLAEAVVSLEYESETPTPSGDTSATSLTGEISPELAAALTLPSTAACKPKPRRTLNVLPDNLTSKDCIRTLALKNWTKRKCLLKEKGRRRRDFIRSKMETG